jgi:hypothetical protein
MTLDEATRILRRVIMADDHRLLGSKQDASGVMRLRLRWPAEMLDGSWRKGFVELDGWFTADELEALAVWMRAHQG